MKPRPWRAEEDGDSRPRGVGLDGQGLIDEDLRPEAVLALQPRGAASSRRWPRGRVGPGLLHHLEGPPPRRRFVRTSVRGSFIPLRTSATSPQPHLAAVGAGRDHHRRRSSAVVNSPTTRTPHLPGARWIPTSGRSRCSALILWKTESGAEAELGGDARERGSTAISARRRPGPARPPPRRSAPGARPDGGAPERDGVAARRRRKTARLRRHVELEMIGALAPVGSCPTAMPTLSRTFLHALGERTRELEAHETSETSSRDQEKTRSTPEMLATHPRTGRVHRLLDVPAEMRRGRPSSRSRREGERRDRESVPSRPSRGSPGRSGPPTSSP